MGETAENLRLVGPKITREEQDRFALESHRRAVAATESGKFSEEIVPVPVPQKKGGLALVTRDEHPRPDTSLEALAKLPPAFREGGTVTAGNSSGVNDGAAAVLMMSDAKAKELGLQPMARIVASAAAGVEPRTMGLGPVPATRKALARADPFFVSEAIERPGGMNNIAARGFVSHFDELGIGLRKNDDAPDVVSVPQQQPR